MQKKIVVRKQSLQVPASRGAPISTGFECPYCFSEIPRASTRCRHCGGKLKNGKKVKQKTGVGIAHFLNVLGCAACMFLWLLPQVWGALYVAALVVSIVSLMRGSKLSGVTALLGSIALPWVTTWVTLNLIAKALASGSY